MHCFALWNSIVTTRAERNGGRMDSALKKSFVYKIMTEKLH